MLRILHVSYQRFYAPGILRQLEQEQEAAERLGLNWKSRLFLPADISSGSRTVVHGRVVSSRRRASRKEYYRWVEEEMQDADILLLRYSTADPYQSLFISRSTIPVFLIHHTIELAEILSEGTPKSRIKWLFERMFGPASLAKAAGLIAVTREIGAFELERIRGVKPVLTYPNGISMSADPSELIEIPTTEPVKIIFVASYFASWHGLDRLIEAARLSQEEFIIYVVGNVGPNARAQAGSDARIVFPGVLSSGEINKILDSCHLALSSFALERKKLTEASTLKVREYLARGIPVYSGHLDVFPDDFPFYRCGPCDMEAILNMAREATLWDREEIRSAAKPYIDKAILVSRLYAALSDLQRA